jgi:hypothetical protein
MQTLQLCRIHQVHSHQLTEGNPLLSNLLLEIDKKQKVH